MYKNALFACAITLALLFGERLINGAAVEASIVELMVIYGSVYFCLSYKPAQLQIDVKPEGAFIKELLVALNHKDTIIAELRTILRDLEAEENKRIEAEKFSPKCGG